MTTNANVLLKSESGIQIAMIAAIKAGSTKVSGYDKLSTDAKVKFDKLVGKLTDAQKSTGRGGSKIDLKPLLGAEYAKYETWKAQAEGFNKILATKDVEGKSKIRVHYYSHNDQVK